LKEPLVQVARSAQETPLAHFSLLFSATSGVLDGRIGDLLCPGIYHHPFLFGDSRDAKLELERLLNMAHRYKVGAPEIT